MQTILEQFEEADTRQSAHKPKSAELALALGRIGRASITAAHADSCAASALLVDLGS